MYNILPYVQLARPQEYVKNSFIWIPIFFGHKLTDFSSILQTFWGFVAFCVAASSVYVFNDLRDVEEDRQHPTKRSRPLASGMLGPSQAILFLSGLVILFLLISIIFLTKNFLVILGLYMLLNFAYSCGLKNFSIIDVVCIALGFILRVFAGGVTAKVWISHWLILITFLLALFLALAKRRDDIILATGGHSVRKCIKGYNLEFVSLSMVLIGSVTIVSYILYTLSPGITSKHGTTQLYLTVFWVIIGLLRYMQIMFVKQRTDSPTLILLKDWPLIIVILSWFLSFNLLIYVF